MSANRLKELDALRGLAALAVVIYHYLHHFHQIYGHENLPTGWAVAGKFGVHLFFMISGFVIYWSISRVHKPIEFLLSRFSRLFPAYWCAIFLTFLGVWLFGLPGREVQLIDAVANLSMLQEFLGIPHVDGVYWTLTLELTFYLWIFALASFRLLAKAELLFLIFALLGAMDEWLQLGLGSGFERIFMLKYAAFFAVGICSYKLTQCTEHAKLWWIIAVALGSTVMTYSATHALVHLIIFGLFYLAIAGYLKWLLYGPWLFLGSISYSLYLIHQNLGYVVIREAYNLGLSAPWGVLLAFMSSLLLATLMVRYIERPGLNYFRRKLLKA